MRQFVSDFVVLSNSLSRLRTESSRDSGLPAGTGKKKRGIPTGARNRITGRKNADSFEIRCLGHLVGMRRVNQHHSGNFSRISIGVQLHHQTAERMAHEDVRRFDGSSLEQRVQLLDDVAGHSG